MKKKYWLFAIAIAVAVIAGIVLGCRIGFNAACRARVHIACEPCPLEIEDNRLMEYSDRIASGESIKKIENEGKVQIQYAIYKDIFELKIQSADRQITAQYSLSDQSVEVKNGDIVKIQYDQKNYLYKWDESWAKHVIVIDAITFGAIFGVVIFLLLLSVNKKRKI